MHILGVHQAHNATAALLKDGKIIAAASEERFTRKKNQFGVPFQAIKFCLDFAQIKPEEVDLIVLAGSTWPNYVASLETAGARRSKLYPIFLTLRNIHQKIHMFLLYLEYRIPFFKGLDILFNRTLYWLISKVFYPKIFDLLIDKFGFAKERFLVADHHLTHALAALYGSPYPKEGKDALVFTCDGGGDGLSSTVSLFRKGRLKRLIATSDQNSLGAFFAGLTQFMGMKPLEDEYKLMGLAPYASPEGEEKAFKIMNHYIKFLPQSLTFKNRYTPDVLWHVFRKELTYLRFDWLAGAGQKMVEELLVAWVKAAIKKYKIRTIVCGGGVFMNVKANLKISQLPEVKEMFVFPSGGDESTALGACYYGFLLQQKGKSRKIIPEPITDLYLGPAFSEKEIKQALDKNKINQKYDIDYHQNIEEVVISLLTRGETVARFAGRMEWGARALGNRSILADPTKDGVIEEINKMIKKRDFWMPFAPTILKEEESKYLDNPKKIEAPYMAFAFPSLAQAHHDLRAAIHPYDKTLRPQVLGKDANPSYYRLLKNFQEKTGRGGFLNTSFNIHGDPIVCSPQDALEAFENSELKFLALGCYLVSKKRGGK